MANENSRLGENLARIRKENKMSQSELASLLSVSVSAVSKWENSKNLPDIEMVRSIAEIFHVPMDAILGTTFSEPNKDVPPKTENIPLVSQKKSHMRIILISLGIVVVIIGIVFYILYQNYLDSLPYRVINSRSIMGDKWGPTTEISVLYNTVLNDELLDIISYEVKGEWLEEDKHGGEFVNAIKVSLYQDKHDANSFSNQTDGYFYLLSPQKDYKKQ